jgi:hypothetical protein
MNTTIRKQTGGKNTKPNIVFMRNRNGHHNTKLEFRVVMSYYTSLRSEFRVVMSYYTSLRSEFRVVMSYYTSKGQSKRTIQRNWQHKLHEEKHNM